MLDFNNINHNGYLLQIDRASASVIEILGQGRGMSTL